MEPHKGVEQQERGAKGIDGRGEAGPVDIVVEAQRVVVKK